MTQTAPQTGRTAGRPDRPAHPATVVGRTPVSENLLRLTLHCPEVASGAIAPSEFTDTYVKIELPDATGDRVLRTYTIRDWRPEVGEIDLDFVVHGDQGVAGPWARTVELGSDVTFRGPGGGYAPLTGADAPAHLLVGDLAALPAIEAALAAIGPEQEGQVVIAHTDERDVRELATHLPTAWVIDSDIATAYDAAAEYVENWQHEGPVQTFVHGEAGFVRRLRRHLRVDRGVPAELQSISGYWKLGRNDAQWRVEKKEWRAPVDEAEAALVES